MILERNRFQEALKDYERLTRELQKRLRMSDTELIELSHQQMKDNS